MLSITRSRKCPGTDQSPVGRSPVVIGCILQQLRMLFIVTFCVCSVLMATKPSFSQSTTSSFAVKLTATVQNNPPTITLNWPSNPYALGVTLYKRQLSGNTNFNSGWSLVSSNSTFVTSYVDTQVTSGVLYEYKAVSSCVGYYDPVIGMITTGINVPLNESRGKVILIVDSTNAQNLATELARLIQDLAGDGWTVIRHDVQPTDSPVAIRTVIQSDFSADPTHVKSVFLFGAVPIPYAGPVAPDGHNDSYAPWPADIYYGVMNGQWVPGTPANNWPPYFANTFTPGEADLEVGRVDLSHMPAFGPKTEVDLLRQYLDKDHRFRIGLVNAQKRGLITDHFNYVPFLGGEDFSASAYDTFAALLGPANINDTAWLGAGISDANYDQTFPTLASYSYLWSGIFSGGMSNGVYYTGMTIEWAARDPKTVFTMSFGSSFGYWSGVDNFLRAPLGAATMGLSNSWSGRPRQFFHRTGMGLTLGDSMRTSQNTAREVWTALMGDPTLRVFTVAPPPAIAAQFNGQMVTVNWTASPDAAVQGYAIYRSSSPAGPFTRLNSQLVSGTSYSDPAPAVGTNWYMVRAIKLETTFSGTFSNASQGTFQAVTVSGTGPSVSLIGPSNNCVIGTPNGAPASVTLTAAASSSVAKIEFFVNGSKVGEDTTIGPITAPSMTDTSGPSIQGYSLAWTAPGPGNYSVRAVATDLSGNSTSTDPATLELRPLLPPQITATLTSAATLNAGDKFTLDVSTASPTPSDQVAKVQLLVGGSVVAERKTTELEYDFISSINFENNVQHWPYRLAFVGTQPGVYQLIARSITNFGMTADAAPIQVTVIGSSGGPSVSITSPSNGTQVLVGSSTPVQVNATTSAPNDFVAKVDLNVNGAKSDTSTTAPFTTTFRPTSAGVYALTAVATNSTGQTATSTAISVTVVNPPPPGIPTGVTATPGNAQVTVAWSPVSGAASYNLYRALTPGGEGSTPYKSGITVASYIDTPLTNGTTYYYKVTAANSAGESGQSAEVSATPRAATGSAIYRINCGGGAIGSFAADNYFTGGIAWSTSHLIDTSGAADPAPMAVYQTVRYDPSQFSYVFPGLTAGAAYRVRLHMVEPVSFSSGTRPMNIDINGTRMLTAYDPANAAGGSFKAVIPEFTIPADANGKIKITFTRINGDVPCVAAIEILTDSPQAPSTPTGVTASAGNAQVSVAWNAVSGATSYNLYRSTSAGGEGLTAYKTGITTTSYLDTGLTNGATYYYKVSAVNAAGESGQSVEVNATPTGGTVPQTPTGVTALGGSTQVTVGWIASAGAASYNVYRGLTPGGEGSTPYKSSITATSYIDTAVTNGTMYYYRVSAVNSVGESGQSVEVSAAPHSTDVSAIYRVNCGGGAVGSFSADSFFVGGIPWSTTQQMDTSRATNPAPASAYQTVRYDPSQFSYVFPGLTVGAAYRVRLHMIEPFSTSFGTRPMNIDINGSRVLAAYDPAIAAGGSFKAVIPEFTIPADSAGKIKITFTRINGDVPCVAAIEILTDSPQAPSTPTGVTATAGNAQVTVAWNAVSGAASYNLYRSTTPGGEGTVPYKAGLTAISMVDTGLANGTTYYYRVSAVNAAGESGQSVEVSTTPRSSGNNVIYRINCGGGAIGAFAADSFFIAGIPWSTTQQMDISGVTDPAPMAAYQTIRYSPGVFSYSFPGLTVGATYRVRLHMIEPFSFFKGTRPMNVDINGTRVLTNYDPATAAGQPFKAVIPEFYVAADSDGKIGITFIRTIGDVPCVAAIEILQ